MATGTPRINRSRQRLGLPAQARGFTLIEILVVVFIVGLLTAGAVLALGSLGRDRILEHEAQRLQALLDYAREQAELQTREYGLRVLPDGYEFVVLDVNLAQSQWQVVDTDDSLRPRKLPAGLQPEMYVEGRRVVLTADRPNVQPVPQVMLMSSRDISSFELRLRRSGVPGDYQIRNSRELGIELIAPTTTAARP